MFGIWEQRGTTLQPRLWDLVYSVLLKGDCQVTKVEDLSFQSSLSRQFYAPDPKGIYCIRCC